MGVSEDLQTETLSGYCGGRRGVVRCSGCFFSAELPCLGEKGKKEEVTGPLKNPCEEPLEELEKALIAGVT